MDFRTPVEIAEAFVGFLQELTWTDAAGISAAAFQRVELWDSLNLPDALQRLIMSEERFALVVWTGSDWDIIRPADYSMDLSPAGRRTVHLTVIVSDRVIGSHLEAVTGGDANPGCLALQEMAIQVCSGPLFSAEPKAWSRPVTDSLGEVREENSTKRGRAICSIEFAVETRARELVS